MQNRRVFLWIGVIVGAAMIGAAILGILGAFLGVGRAFQVLGARGIGDPHGLSTAVAGTMLAGAGGLVVFPCGVVLLAFCLSLLRRSPRTGPPPLPRFSQTSEEKRNRD